MLLNPWRWDRSFNRWTELETTSYLLGEDTVPPWSFLCAQHTTIYLSDHAHDWISLSSWDYWFAIAVLHHGACMQRNENYSDFPSLKWRIAGWHGACTRDADISYDGSGRHLHAAVPGTWMPTSPRQLLCSRNAAGHACFDVVQGHRILNQYHYGSKSQQWRVKCCSLLQVVNAMSVTFVSRSSLICFNFILFTWRGGLMWFVRRASGA